ncbi:AraC family transcriptional regulator [Mariniphaga sediminis]|uniref:AraC family transcriptional regulator n=1 Tax=Mariniphaga sediminis TaxID=1628158 RepID=A0A399D103_9BACT|nr:AraC family transcriptional regulator [Mariniphaga sediminis]RIH65544.1 AraC family transcriptional regulator [Mariniphaga sediminis]
MKAQYQKIIMNEGVSFIAKKLEFPRFDSEFHFHAEYELKYVLHSKGKRFVGDSVENFKEGDLVLLGSNIPHYWKNDPIYFEKDDLLASAYLIMFSEDFLGHNFFHLPEMAPIKTLLNKAKGGVCFGNKDKCGIPKKMKQLLSSEGPSRIIILLDILFDLAKAEIVPLLTETFVSEIPMLNYSDHSLKRMTKVHEYVIENFRNKIEVQDVASIANMTSHAFCKYFKKSTKKTFMTFLGELRICHAKKLLIEKEEMAIADICYASGFDNLSNFNRKFRSITDLTPTEFRSNYIKDTV